MLDCFVGLKNYPPVTFSVSDRVLMETYFPLIPFFFVLVCLQEYSCTFLARFFFFKAQEAVSGEFSTV